MERTQAIRVLRDNLRTALAAESGKKSKLGASVRPGRAKWQAAGLSFDRYRGLGNRQILFDCLVACYDVDPQDALYEIITLPAAEAAVRRRLVPGEIDAQRARWAKPRRRRVRPAA